MTWQPIATAPKDGSPVLVCVADKPSENCCYQPDKAWWSEGPPSGWVVALTDAGKRIGLAIKPTHWMDLPAPPLASADTHPKDGDVKQAPLVSGAVPKADAQPSGPILPNKERPPK